jgi:hypothetical protein
MTDILVDLRTTIEEKKISPQTTAIFTGDHGGEVRGWLREESVPNFSSRKKIRRGIRRIQITP